MQTELEKSLNFITTKITEIDENLGKQEADRAAHLKTVQR